jgi:hypothetical protein
MYDLQKVFKNITIKSKQVHVGASFASVIFKSSCLCFHK